MLKFFKTLFAVGVLSAFLTGCNSGGGSAPSVDVPKKIIGKWQNKIKQSDGIEFLKDGTFIIKDKDGQYPGTFSKIDDKRIKITGQGGSLVWNFEVKGDELAIHDEGKPAKDEDKYTKVK